MCAEAADCQVMDYNGYCITYTALEFADEGGANDSFDVPGWGWGWGWG